MTLFVSRGSKLAPNESLIDNVQELKASSTELKHVQSEIRVLQATDPTAPVLTDLRHSAESLTIQKSQHVIAIEEVLKQLLAGGFAGAISRTCVAPLDRIKILMQTQKFTLQNQTTTKYTGIFQSIATIMREESVFGLWRGNFVNCLRILPYSGLQFASYDTYKRYLFHADQLQTGSRLLCGALAAVTATSVTHPLDVIRLRMSVNTELKSIFQTTTSIMAENGVKALFKGYIPTILSVSPFIAINFACFDGLKSAVVRYDSTLSKSSVVTLGLGAVAGLIAQTICYPLDTVRRRMQLKGIIYPNLLSAFVQIIQTEGIRGFYIGQLANAIKIVPNNAIRFVAYEWIKSKWRIKGKEGGGGGG